MQSDLEILVESDMIELGFDPNYEPHVRQFWELKLDDN